MWIWPKLKQQEANSSEHEAKLSIWGNSFPKPPCTSYLATLSWIGSSFLLCFQTVLRTTKTFRSFSLLWELLIAFSQFPLRQKRAKCPLKEQYYGKALHTNHYSSIREKFSKTLRYHHQIQFLRIWGLTLQPMFTLIWKLYKAWE